MLQRALKHLGFAPKCMDVIYEKQTETLSTYVYCFAGFIGQIQEKFMRMELQHK